MPNRRALACITAWLAVSACSSAEGQAFDAAAGTDELRQLFGRPASLGPEIGIVTQELQRLDRHPDARQVRPVLRQAKQALVQAEQSAAMGRRDEARRSVMVARAALMLADRTLALTATRRMVQELERAAAKAQESKRIACQALDKTRAQLARAKQGPSSRRLVTDAG
ncbi:MAG: hypothetical protein MJD61_14395 [Proteobacteria bacterium]|nr:hypothetical protein [Pseudomonadota bacterium]